MPGQLCARAPRTRGRGARHDAHQRDGERHADGDGRHYARHFFAEIIEHGAPHGGGLRVRTKQAGGQRLGEGRMSGGGWQRRQQRHPPGPGLRPCQVLIKFSASVHEVIGGSPAPGRGLWRVTGARSLVWAAAASA